LCFWLGGLVCGCAVLSGDSGRFCFVVVCVGVWVWRGVL
jgi:hypothetical protein